MGTGSSRNQVTIETLPGPPPAADDDADDVVVTRARRQPVRQKTIEKIVTETGAEVGKLKDKQEDILDVTSIHDDDDLEDIQELEQTFDSLGIPSSDDRSKASNDREVPPLRKWNGASLSEDSPKKEVVLDGNPAAVGWSAIRSSSGPQTRLDVPQTTFVNNNNFNNTKSAPTKFTWTSPELPRSKEDWIYQKVRLQLSTYVKVRKLKHIYWTSFYIYKVNF